MSMEQKDSVEQMEVMQGRPPVIQPGYTFATVTDKISSIVLTRPTSFAWLVGVGFAAADPQHLAREIRRHHPRAGPPAQNLQRSVECARAQIQHAPGSVTDALRDIEYDLYYTKHFSLPLDAYILLYTIRAILPFQDR